MKCNDCQREQAPDNLEVCLSKGEHCKDRLQCIRTAYPETAVRKKYHKRASKKRIFLKTGEWLYIENGVTKILK